VQAIFGWALLLRGDAPGARLALEEAERLAAQLDPLGPHWPWHHLLLRARVPLGDFERALEDGLAIADRARDAGALATLGGALVVAADAAFRLGRWDVADDATSEAIRVAVETGQHSWHGYALSTRTRLLAARGCEAEGRRAGATALAIAESMRISSGLRFVHGAVGFLELSAGNVAGAIAELEAIERLVAGSGLGEPTLVPWAPDLVEAHVRSGRLEDARRVLAELELQAATSGTVFAGAAAARCRGMLEDDFEPAFAQALALHERCPLPFERARTLLALGRRLHRTRRRAEARERLREALGGFEQLGAAAWAAQARDELRAAGARRGGAPPPRSRRRADAPGAAGGRGRRAWRVEPRGRRRAVPRPEDDRVPPAADLPQARDPLPHAARRRAVERDTAGGWAPGPIRGETVTFSGQPCLRQ